MKLQRMTGRWWLELLFGVVVPAVSVVPWSVTYLWVVVAGLADGSLVRNSTGIFWGFLFFLMGTVPLLAVISLGFLILFGIEKVNGCSLVRWSMVILAILGLLMAGYFFVATLPAFWGEGLHASLNYLRQHHSGIAFWVMFIPVLLFEDGRIVCFTLLGPIFVGLRYLLRLLRAIR